MAKNTEPSRGAKRSAGHDSRDARRKDTEDATVRSGISLVPDTGMDVEGTVALLRKADDAYANAEPIMEDAAYDLLRNRLREAAPDHPYFQDVGQQAGSVVYEKTPHRIPLGSLSKIRPSEAGKLIARELGGVWWVATPKLDGISLSLTYEKGRLVQALTRGDGRVGQNVTAWVQEIPSIPKIIPVTTRDCIFMGEAIMSREWFEALKEEGGYANPRNAVAGAFRKKDFDAPHKEVLRAITFITWRLWDVDSLAETDADRFIQQARQSKEVFLVGKISPECSCVIPRKFRSDDDGTLFDMEDGGEMIDLSDSAEAGGKVHVCDTMPRPASMGKDARFTFDCDGWVIAPYEISDRRRMGSMFTTLPKWAFAVKPDVSAQRRLSGVVDRIEWEISVRGILTPVCVMEEPLDFNGVKVTRCTLHNKAYVRELHIGNGSTVEMIRSGDVIPRIISATASDEMCVPDTCPYCGEELEETEAVLYCGNLSCKGVEGKRLWHFIKAMDIDGISEESSSLLYGSGIVSVLDLLHTPEKVLVEVLGESRGGILFRGIHDWNPTESELMYASGLFCSTSVSLGVQRIQTILEDGVTAPGIGKAIARFYERILPEYQKWAAELDGLVKVRKATPAEEGKLTGMSFAFTGFRDKELEETIRRNGGKVESVKKTTTALFGKADSTKARKAVQYGVPIIAPEDARSHVNNLLGMS